MKRISGIIGTIFLVGVVCLTFIAVHPLLWSNLGGVLYYPFGLPAVIHDEFFNDPTNPDTYRPLRTYHMTGVSDERITRELLTGTHVPGAFDEDPSYEIIQSYKEQCWVSLLAWAGIIALIWLSIHIKKKRPDLQFFIPWAWAILLSTPLICQADVTVLRHLNGVATITATAAVSVLVYSILASRTTGNSEKIQDSSQAEN